MAEREIIAAAEELLRERPFRDLLSSLGRTPCVAPETVIETLATIWTRTLYGAS